MGQDVGIRVTQQTAGVGHTHTSEHKGPAFNQAVGIISKTYAKQKDSSVNPGSWMLDPTPS
jgi:hypothetical protein